MSQRIPGDGSISLQSPLTQSGNQYTFATVSASVLVRDEGARRAGVTVRFYSDGWRTFGTSDSNGYVVRELLPGARYFTATGFAQVGPVDPAAGLVQLNG